MKTLTTCLLLLLLLQGCASQNSPTGNAQIAKIQSFLEARANKDEATYLKMVSPKMRVWYEKKQGEGSPWNPRGAWGLWDEFFNGKKSYGEFQTDSNAVTVRLTETNDFFALIERPASPVQLTWWFDAEGLIEGYLVQSLSGDAVPDRLAEFEVWAKKEAPAELAYLMPDGRINPDGDRPQRWKALLLRWRETLRGTPKSLDITFIGNEAFKITDGSVTLLSDFPYQSGAHGYMTYDLASVQVEGKTLCLITHEHTDHFAPKLWEGKGWHLVASPLIKTAGGGSLRLPFSDTIAFEGIRIFPHKTPHTDAHYSYLVEWHGKKLYFPGDTDVLDFLPKEKVDVLFITPWLLDRAQKRKLTLNAGKVVVYHHRDNDKIQCDACVVPQRGWQIRI